MHVAVDRVSVRIRFKLCPQSARVLVFIAWVSHLAIVAIVSVETGVTVVTVVDSSGEYGATHRYRTRLGLVWAVDYTAVGSLGPLSLAFPLSVTAISTAIAIGVFIRCS